MLWSRSGNGCRVPVWLSLMQEVEVLRLPLVFGRAHAGPAAPGVRGVTHPCLMARFTPASPPCLSPCLCAVFSARCKRALRFFYDFGSF